MPSLEEFVVMLVAGVAVAIVVKVIFNSWKTAIQPFLRFLRDRLMGVRCKLFEKHSRYEGFRWGVVDLSAPSTDLCKYCGKVYASDDRSVVP